MPLGGWVEGKTKRAGELSPVHSFFFLFNGGNRSLCGGESSDVVINYFLGKKQLVT